MSTSSITTLKSKFDTQPTAFSAFFSPSGRTSLLPADEDLMSYFVETSKCKLSLPWTRSGDQMTSPAAPTLTFRRLDEHPTRTSDAGRFFTPNCILGVNADGSAWLFTVDQVSASKVKAETSSGFVTGTLKDGTPKDC